MKNYIFPGIKTNVFLAPMAGVTDLAFRMICREFGAKFCFFEMIDVFSILYGHPKSLGMIKTLKKDRPIAAQLLGSEPSRVLDAAHKLLDLADVSFIDINAACPAKKVIKKKAGAYLLRDRSKLSRIIKVLSEGIKKPVTVKLRTNYGPRDIKECVQTALECQDSGAHAVFIHGRTVSQGYAGAIDYEAINRVKESLSVPVIGSGNIFNGESSEEMISKTGCDGILVARGAQGRPWVFKEIDDYFSKGVIAKDKTVSFKKRVLKKHLSYIGKYKEMKDSDRVGFMSKVSMYYIKGLPNAARIRDSLSRARSIEALNGAIEGL